MTADRKLLKKAYSLSGEPSNRTVHHIFLIVASTVFRSVTLQSDGYGRAFYKIMGNNGCALVLFETMCRGGDILATLQKPAKDKEDNRDGLRADVRDMIVEHISESSGDQGSSRYHWGHRGLAFEKHLDSLTATKKALEAGELKLMPVGR
jgi:hypothetical protein